MVDKVNLNVALSWYRKFVLVIWALHLVWIIGYTFFYFGRTMFHPSAFKDGAEYYWFLVGEMIAFVYAVTLYSVLNGTADCCSLATWASATVPLVAYAIVEVINFGLQVTSVIVRSANFEGQNCREVMGSTPNCERVNTLLIVGNALAHAPDRGQRARRRHCADGYHCN